MLEVKINSLLGNEIITAAEVKSYVRIDTDEDDAIISNMITQARIWCENYISKDIVPKNRTLYVDKTEGLIPLMFYPIASVIEVTENNVSIDYTELGIEEITIELTKGPAKNVKVNYTTAGLNDGLIKQALLQMVSNYYDNRADFVIGSQINEIPTDVKSILTPYKAMFI